MTLIYKMESVLITIISVLCTILIFKLLYRLRSSLRWRANCWFCNDYSWVKYIERNCWTCPKCEQYNGFTKEGDYNKPIFTAADQALKTPKVFQRSPPKNGLCKMCNINQQLKVAQLANFVPMYEKRFEEEIESYKIQLEKAYKLCTPCKKVLQMKLHKEKETLLGIKLLETRTLEKKNQKQEAKNQRLKSLINNTSKFVAGILFIFVLFECYQCIENKNLFNKITNIKEILSDVLERVVSIVKMKTVMTFPSLENYLNDVNIDLYLDMLPKPFNISTKSLDHINVLTQQALGGFVCLIQIIGHVWSTNKLKHAIIIDLLWSIFVVTSIAHHTVTVDQTIISVIKLLSTSAVLLVYSNIKTKTVKPAARIPTTPKKIKNLHNRTINSVALNEDTSALETDDDVSLSKFGLHNFSDSSSETGNQMNSSLINGRSFTPRSVDSMWTKPKLNSTFCVNTVISKSPSSVSDTVFIKPSFNKYQNLAKSDSDSDLDESISTLCISSPKKSKKNNNSIFSLRTFTASPNFVAPTPLNRSRPLISPSKLGHSTSWVAGGYWGSEGERQIFSIDGSRSSSQSSGFESQASSMNQRNVFSQPSSREESDCGEHDRGTLLDRFQNNCNMSSYNMNIQAPRNFSRMSSPVFPQMQYNGHVHIPQPRFAQHNSVCPNVFVQQQYAQHSTFKTPGGSGLIKLPQVNSFASR